jgi:hypothetical protein
MKSPKAPPKFAPTTTDLRVKDPKVLHAEIDHFRQKIAELSAATPQKSAIILAEWLAKPAETRKKAA